MKFTQALNWTAVVAGHPVQKLQFQLGEGQGWGSTWAVSPAMVIQKIRHPRMQQVAIKLTSLGAVRRRDCSNLQPDFRIL
jgi:hypothetical protein